MVTVVPRGPDDGEKPVMSGMTRKLVELVADPPPEEVTRIGPLEALLGTVAVSWVADVTLTLVDATPLKYTEPPEAKPVPLTVTVVPVVALLGENPLTERLLEELPP
jgi:hypothetical protein